MHLEPAQVPNYLKQGYTGKRFQAEPAESVTVPYHAGLWDGGSRTIYKAVELATGKTAAVSDNLSAPWHGGRADYKIPLKSGFAIVKHVIFCGTDLGLTFYVHPSDISKLIPEQKTDDLSPVEVKVLAIIRGLKSGYRADEFRRQGISVVEVEAIKAKLTRLDYLNKAGAITISGKNRAGDTRPY
jgi:hypothetical protein